MPEPRRTQTIAHPAARRSRFPDCPESREVGRKTTPARPRDRPPEGRDSVFPIPFFDRSGLTSIKMLSSGPDARIPAHTILLPAQSTRTKVRGGRRMPNTVLDDPADQVGVTGAHRPSIRGTRHMAAA